MRTGIVGGLAACGVVRWLGASNSGAPFSATGSFPYGRSSLFAGGRWQGILDAQLRGDLGALAQGRRNALHAIRMLQKADDALATITSVLDELKQLAGSAAPAGSSDAQTAALQARLETLTAKIDRVVDSSAEDSRGLLGGSGNGVDVFLGQLSPGSANTIRIEAHDVTSEGLGLVGEPVAGTTASLVANSEYGVNNPSDPYVKGPARPQDPSAILSFTFHGSSGARTVVVEVRGNTKLADLASAINSQAAAQVPGWMPAEAVQVAGTWVLSTSTYEAGAYAAPTVEVEGDLSWKVTQDPVSPSHFAGEPGSSGSVGGPLQLGDPQLAYKISEAIQTAEGIRARINHSLERLGIAASSAGSAEGHTQAAEGQIADQNSAVGAARAVRRQLLAGGAMTVLLQGQLPDQRALSLLGIPIRSQGSSPPESVSLWA